MDKLTLLIGDTVHAGWKSVEYTRSIERGDTPFRLTVSEKWATSSERRTVSPGQAARLQIAGRDLVRGYIVDVSTAYGVSDHSLDAIGHDRMGDLIDCAATLTGPYEMAGLTLLEIAQRICEPYGISCRAEVDVGQPFGRFSIEPGESAWEAIERAARQRALLPNGDGLGGLVFTRAGRGGRATGSIELGVNASSADGTYSYRDRHSIVVVRGQQEGSDDLDAEETVGPQGSARDDSVTRYRPLVVMAEQPGSSAAMQDRAIWQQRVARGRSRKLTYTVPGWYDEGGTLWQINRLVRVKDSYMYLDQDMLISAVSQTFDIKSGYMTEITVALPDAYDLIAEPEEAASKSGASADDDADWLWDE